MIEKMRKELKALEDLLMENRRTLSSKSFEIGNLKGENERLKEDLAKRGERLLAMGQKLDAANCKIDALEMEKGEIIKQQAKNEANKVMDGIKLARVEGTIQEQDRVIIWNAIAGLQNEVNQLNGMLDCIGQQCIRLRSVQ